jgi:uncharacterized membrane protein HdeD (DUF308 family)
MPAYSATPQGSRIIAAPRDAAHRIGATRAALAVVWAAVLVAAVDHNPGRFADLKTGVAIILASYPLIDVVASLAGARFDADARRVLLINAAVSTAAVIALAVTGLGSDAGSTLATFGLWAIASGAIQFGVALYRRHAQGGQIPMLISGGLSVIVGAMFVASSSNRTTHISSLAGYMLLGAVLYAIWALRDAARARRAA